MRTDDSARAAVPTYLALADQLAERVARSRPAERLPSEHELAGEHGVSRVTARAALRELEQRHLVRRIRGRGTFVARRIDYVISPNQPPSWSQTVRAAGGVPEARVLDVSVERADDTVRGYLALPPHARVVVVRRLKLIDGLVAGVSTNRLPASLHAGLSDMVTHGESLYATLRALGFSPVRAWTVARLEAVDAETARLLELEGRPMIWRTGSCLVDARSGRPISCGVGWNRPDVYNFRFEMYNSSGASPAGPATDA